MPSIWEMLQNAATGTYNGMSQAGEELGRGVMDAATLPRDVYQGKVNVDPNTMGDADFGRVLNMAGNVAGGGITTGTASAGGTNLGMFIGQNAKTFPHGDLVSQVMGEGLGRTPQQVYAATGEGAATGARGTTGILRGVDGKPRVEIADNVPLADFGRLRDNSMAPLGSILDHPELYKAYPELQSLNVKSSPDASYYSLKDGTAPAMEMGPHISIARADRSQERMQETLMHEIQHWVQEREGFGQGYNPRGSEIVNSDVIQGMQSNLEQMRLQAMRDHNRYNELGPYGQGVDVNAMTKNIDNYNALAQHIENTKFEAYSRAAGEVEARLTGNRRNMPLAERQKMHPLDYAAADTNPAYGRLSYPPEDQWVPGRTRPFR